MYNSHTRKQSSRKSLIWKNLQGTPRQLTNVECGYYVMRFMRDIIHDPALAFEKKVKFNIKFLYFNTTTFALKTVILLLVTRRFLFFICSLTRKRNQLCIYTQEKIDEVRLEWAEFVNKQLQNNN